MSRAIWAVGLAAMIGWPAAASGEAEAGGAAQPDAVASAGRAATDSAAHVSLVRAIREKRLLHFTYGGHARVVEPYSYGVTTEGVAVLHGYQVAGGSASKPPPGWRTFTVSGVADLLVTERSFRRTRADYSSERPKLDPQWAEVELVPEPAAETKAAEE